MVNQRILPYLSYADAPAALDFLCSAFGFEELARMPMEDGTIGHAEIGYQGHIIMLATCWRATGAASPRELGGIHSQIHCYVDDVDAHYRRAMDAGATIIAEPADQPYGRTYRAVDPEGHRWIFSAAVEDQSGNS
jgi:uncharacterized glyoxalase superfamily protein PhnB